MKIYEIGTGYTPIPAQMGAATEIVVAELTEAFIRKGEDVSILDIKTTHRKPTNLPIVDVNMPKLFMKTDVHLGIMHKLKRIVYSIMLAKRLKRLILNNNSKMILHFHNQYNMYFFLKLVPIRLRQNCLLAYTNHSYIWHNDWDDIRKTINKRYFQELYAMKYADIVYVLNSPTKVNLLHANISKDKIKEICNGVNVNIYHPLTEEAITNLKIEKGFDNKTIYLQVGSVCDRKNQLGALHLLLPILKDDENRMFLFVGGIISSSYMQLIESFVNEHQLSKQVVYYGECEPGMNLNQIYNIASALIFPSTSEGFPLVILEAMSAGIPVLINEKIKFPLAKACLCYKDDASFLDMMYTNIMNSKLRKKHALKVRKIIEDTYSWEKIADSYLETWSQD